MVCSGGNGWKSPSCQRNDRRRGYARAGLRKTPGSAPADRCGPPAPEQRSRKSARAPHRAAARRRAAAPVSSGALHLQKHRAGGPGGDAAPLSVQQRTEPCGAARHSQRRFGILQNQRRDAVLPGSDLLGDPLAQHRRRDGPAVEQHGINARAIAQEFRQMPGYRAVGGIGKPPFPQRRRRLVRPRRLVAVGEEPVQQYALDFRSRHRRRLRAGEHPRPAPGHRDGEPLVRRPCRRQRLLLQIAAGGDELIPLRAGKLAVPAAGKPRLHEDGRWQGRYCRRRAGYAR